MAIVAVDAEGRVWLVRQLREATRKHLVELPAGTREKGEEPLATAKRELREECGLTGGAWTELTAFWTTPGFCREYMHVYLAEGVVTGEADPDEDEVVEIVHGLSRSSNRGSARSRTRRRWRACSSTSGAGRAAKVRASCGSASQRRSRLTSTASR